MADSAITTATFGAVTKNDLDLETTDNVQFAKIGVGVTPDANRLLLVEGNVSGGVMTVNRSNANTTGAQGTLILKATTSGSMGNTYGVSLGFAVQDTDAVENSIGTIQVLRNGADNTGDMYFNVSNAGTPATGLLLSGSTTYSTVTHMGFGGTTPSATSLMNINNEEVGVDTAWTSAQVLRPGLNQNSQQILAGGNFGTHTSGTHALLAKVKILNTGTATNNGATVTNTAGLYIDGAQGTTVSGANYAIWSDAGTNRFDGTVTLGTSITPQANDGAALGTTSLQFSDLFLAEGGVINFDNGDLTLTQSGNTLTLAGGTLVLPAVTTTQAPLKFTTGGTLLTTPEDGAIEMDDNCFYGTHDAGNRGYIPVRHFIRADSSRSLPNDTNENAIFNDPSNGRLTLETGTYLVEGIISVSGMSATSGNASIDLLGAGTATCGTWLWTAMGRDNNSTTAAATVTGSFSVSQQSAASVVTAGTGTALQIMIQGTFEVTSAGTLIPSIDLVTASAATLAAGSYLVFERIGSTSVVSVGQWD